MCQISDKIKFCNCSSASIESLKHYWLLYRYEKQNVSFTLGLAAMPSYLRDENFKINQSTILERLNSKEGFDKNMEFKEKDVFEVGINHNRIDEEQSLFYQFVFKKDRWHPIKLDPFALINKYKAFHFGKLRKPLIRISKTNY